MPPSEPKARARFGQDFTLSRPPGQASALGPSETPPCSCLAQGVSHVRSAEGAERASVASTAKTLVLGPGPTQEHQLLTRMSHSFPAWPWIWAHTSPRLAGPSSASGRPGAIPPGSPKGWLAECSDTSRKGSKARASRDCVGEPQTQLLGSPWSADTHDGPDPEPPSLGASAAAGRLPPWPPGAATAPAPWLHTREVCFPAVGRLRG